MPNNIVSAGNHFKTKSFGDTYIYNINEAMYQKKITEYIMQANQINKLNENFEDIRYDVKKRQMTNYLTKVLDSKNVILMNQAMPLPKAFKVMAANDIKGDGSLKIFIDTSDIFVLNNGKWVCNNIDILIAYLISATNQVIYYADPKRLLMTDSIISNGASAFSSLFTYIIDYLFKITTISSIRDRCVYLSAMYYLISLLGKDINDNTKRLCRNIAGISEKEEQLIMIQLDQEKAFININFFILELNKILKLSKLTIDVVVEKWLYLFGVGTQFALELYPSFATMITNAYSGCYLNNQKTIEKIIGKDMVEITKTIFKVGGESI